MTRVLALPLLEEVTAFANAYGGVLVLGIDESSTKPASYGYHRSAPLSAASQAAARDVTSSINSLRDFPDMSP